MIPTSSADKQNIILKEGQKVMVLKSPKGIYMQLESGKIIAIRTALKVGHNKEKAQQETPFLAREMQKRAPTITTPIKGAIVPAANTSNTSATGTFTPTTNPKTPTTTPRSRGANHVQFGRNNSVGTGKNVKMGTAKPYNMKSNARSDASGMLQVQYPMSNSNSSFDADISDDSQFLEKLGENLANQQNNDDDNKPVQVNKMKENKGNEPMMQINPSSEQQTMMKNPTNPMMQSHADKVNNGVNETLPSMINDKSSNNMQHTQMQNKPEQINRPYHNANPNTFNSENNSNGNNFSAHSNYNYNYNSTNNYPKDVQSVPNVQPGQVAQDSMHQTNVMSSHQPDKYQATPQHVSFS